MDALFENAPKIIEQAAKSPLGLFALMILVLAVLGYFFFKESSEITRLIIFIMMFSGVCIFGFAIFRAVPEKGPITPVPVVEPARQHDLDRAGTDMKQVLAGEFHKEQWAYQGSGYVNFPSGKLDISTHKGNVLVWAKGISNLEDLLFTVDAELVSGDTELGFGPTFWFRNPENYYHFAIQTGGKFRLCRWQNGVPDTLIPWTSSAKIKGVRKVQRLGIATQGRHIRLYVDDAEVGSCEVDRKSAGSIGFYVDSPGLTAIFRNLNLKAR